MYLFQRQSKLLEVGDRSNLRIKIKFSLVALEALKQLEAEGKIRIYSPEQVAELIRQNPKKKISKQANNVKGAMEKNGEILIEGQIPSEFIVPVK